MFKNKVVVVTGESEESAKPSQKNSVRQVRRYVSSTFWKTTIISVIWLISRCWKILPKR